MGTRIGVLRAPPHDHERAQPAFGRPGRRRAGPCYAVRAGIEATLSQTVRSNGLRRTRYRGIAKTHVQHVLTAMACNLTRTADWIAETPRGRTRSSRFHTLCTAAAG
ncbi:transposase [Streptomyces canus]|uniref:transposase n=1 Tax=Streptomyces canus TaxID=58343 RepID=UPI0033AEFDEC